MLRNTKLAELRIEKQSTDQMRRLQTKNSRFHPEEEEDQQFGSKNRREKIRERKKKG